MHALDVNNLTDRYVAAIKSIEFVSFPCSSSCLTFVATHTQ